MTSILRFGLVVLSSCTSTSYSILSRQLVARTVALPATINPWIGPYLSLFVQVLERQGFEIVEGTAPAALTLGLDLDPNPWAMRCTASLWQGEQVLVMAQARNAGFGTVIARAGDGESRQGRGRSVYGRVGQTPRVTRAAVQEAGRTARRLRP